MHSTKISLACILIIMTTMCNNGGGKIIEILQTYIRSVNRAIEVK